MKRHTGQQVFAFNKLQEMRALVPESGVSVTVELWTGNEWIESSGSPVADDRAIFSMGMRLRMTPEPISGSYYFDSE